MVGQLSHHPMVMSLRIISGLSRTYPQLSLLCYETASSALPGDCFQGSARRLLPGLCQETACFGGPVVFRMKPRM